MSRLPGHGCPACGLPLSPWLRSTLYGKETTRPLIKMPNGAKHWCFTLNNPSDNEQQSLDQLGSSQMGTASIVYLVYGKETGENGTFHLQGFISFSKRKSLRQLKKIIPRAHLEIAKGTPEQAATYCKKDGDYQEFGQLPGGRGKRTDLESLWHDLKDGKSAQEVANKFPSLYIRYRRNILASIRDHQPGRSWETNVIVLWGPTGTGKTRYVYDQHPIESIYTHPGAEWFDGYEGQEIALFDDYNGSEFKLTYLLKLLDRYQMRVPVKGDYVQWAPKTIYFTSNRDPNEWYSNALPEHREALFRRIKEIRLMTF